MFRRIFVISSGALLTSIVGRKTIMVVNGDPEPFGFLHSANYLLLCSIKQRHEKNMLSSPQIVNWFFLVASRPNWLLDFVYKTLDITNFTKHLLEAIIWVITLVLFYSPCSSHALRRAARRATPHHWRLMSNPRTLLCVAKTRFSRPGNFNSLN